MEALAIVAQQANTHPQVRAVLACVSTHFKQLVATTKLDHTKVNFQNAVLKGKLADTITLTQARQFQLTDEDLELLDYNQAYIARYKTTATYFNRLDVISLRLAKYGALHVKKVSVAREKRVDTLVALNIDTEHVCVENYLKNGIGGIKVVRARFLLHSQHDLDDVEWRSIFAGRLTVERAIRRRCMRCALARHGLELRYDSRLCGRFIDEGVGDIDAIAVEMKVMHILHTQTNYRKVLNSMHGSHHMERSTDAKRIVMNGKKFRHLFRFIY